MIDACAPLRISLCGGGTDHPSWYHEYGGVVLSVAINRYAHCQIRQAEHHVGSPMTHSSYWCDTPVGSGLGGSSAVAVTVVAANDALHGIKRCKQETLECAKRMERGHLQVAGGDQDYYPAVYGGCAVLDFGASGVIRHLVPQVHSDPLASWLMLCWTGQRENKKLAAIKDDAIKTSDETKKALRRTIELTRAMHLAMLAGNYLLVGYLMQEAWRRKKESSPGCQTARADLLIQNALAAGALGGKLCGSGGGGYLLLCSSPEKQGAVKAALEPMDCVCEPVEFDHNGLTVVGTL